MRVSAFLAAAIGILFSIGCTTEKPGKPGAPAAGAYDGGGVAFDAAPRGDGAASPDAIVDGAGDDGGAVDDTGEPIDAALPVTCASSAIAFGTKEFVAAGTTPKAFADAFNAELAAMTYPGPALFVFRGLDGKDAAKWRLDVGPLALEGAGPAVKFASAPATVSFKTSPGILLEVPDAETAGAKLRFDTASTKVDLPVFGLKLAGAAPDCAELSIDQLVVAIPATAKDLPFAGKTVGELMGAPIGATGSDPGIYVLELFGSTKKLALAGGGT